MKIEKEDLIRLEIEFKPQVDKLKIYLKKNNIFFDIDDWNMYFFKKDDNILTISLWYMYRQSGICSILEHIDEKSVKPIKVDNNMFYNNYVKPVIDLYFE